MIEFMGQIPSFSFIDQYSYAVASGILLGHGYIFIIFNVFITFDFFINPLTAISRGSGYKLFVTRYRQPAFRIEHYMQKRAVSRCYG